MTEVIREDHKASAQPSINIDALQRHASDPNWSVWVGASAGSGKTKVLADRVTRLLLAGVAPQKLLCLTFTRAAAAEMAIRLTQRLSVWATCEEELLDKELIGLEGDGFAPALRARARRLFAQVLSCPGGMRIQTIHAFAQEILRRFPLEAGLAPNFAVIEEIEAKALWQEAFDTVLESACEGTDARAAEALAYLVEHLAEESLRGLMREIGAHAPRIEAQLMTHGGFEGFVRSLRAALDLGPEEDEIAVRLAAVQEGCFARASLQEAARLLLEKASKTYAERAAKISHWLAQDEEGRVAWFDDYARAFLTEKGEPYKDVANKALLQERPDLEEIFRQEARRILDVQARLELVQTATETKHVLFLALRVAAAYAGRKTELAALDYNDLIIRATALLSRPDIAPWVLYKLDGGIDHILVDESQDTNPHQWRIVEALVEEYFSGLGVEREQTRTLFVVGDEKQSIFSFQGADPEAFARMRGSFAGRIRAAKKKYDEVPLNVSFRSAPAILRAVDAVYACDAARRGVSRDPVSHWPFREEGAGRVEVWPLFVTPEDKKKSGQRLKRPEDWTLPIGYETAHDPAAELARSLAARIQKAIEKGEAVFDRKLKAYRPMNAGDIMVLVQTRGPFVEHLVRALKKTGVPVSGVDRMALTRQLAVMDLMALLQFALLPEDDLTLACVLRGPLIGASEEDLMALAVGRKGSLWAALRHAKGHEVWAAYLAELAATADQTPPLHLLVRILNESCPADAVSGRRAIAGRLGPDAEDPMDELLNAAEEFAGRHSPSLQAFLHWLTSSETEVKREMEAAAGRVRIMTVHASKGLEAPVVILPDTVRVPQKTKVSKLLWDEQAQLPFYVPRAPRQTRLAELYDAAYAKQMEEYRRLLYVALTRPADRLIVCGFRPERTESFDSSWYSLIVSALGPLNQKDTLLVEAAEASLCLDVTPEIVIADYAVDLQGKIKGDARLRGHDGEETGQLDSSGHRNDEALPSWLFAPPLPEPSPPRPFVPSRPSGDEPPNLSPQDARFKRGRLIHRLLQSLPDLDVAKRAEAARRFLSHTQHELDPVQQGDIAKEVLKLLEDKRFAPLFCAESRAEVPIIGLVGERLISGQVDRLVQVGDEVWVVDYKTNRPPPENDSAVPEIYRSQMESYRAVLQEIYPKNTIRCFLLWTYAPRLMEILPRG